MLPLFLGLLILERRHPSRALRVGTWIALVGQVLLTVMELVAITAADAQLTDSTGQLVGALYSVPMILLGVGPVVAGIAALRVGLFDGPGSLVVARAGGLRLRRDVPGRVRPDGGRPHRHRRLAARVRGPRPGDAACGSVAGVLARVLGVALDDDDRIALVEPHVDRRTVGLGDLDLPGRAVLVVPLDALAVPPPVASSAASVARSACAWV